MNITVFASQGNVFTNCECIKSIAFEKLASWVKCALFYRVGCLLPHNSVLARS